MTSQVSDAEKWLAAIVCVIAAMAMRYAGLLALWPRDPGLPVSLMTCRFPVLGVIEMMAIGGVTSALVVVAAGRRLPGIGVLGVGMGLLFLGWGDAQWRLVVAYVQSSANGQWVSTNMLLLGESLGWAAVIVCALIAERIVREWIAIEGGEPGTSRTSVAYSRVSSLIGAFTRGSQHWLMFATAGLGGIVLIEMLYTNNIAANLGQGYFIAAVAMLGGVVLGHQVFTDRALWPVALAWVIPAVVGHIWAIMGTNVADSWWQQGINPLADVLPIQYAAGGTIGSVLGLWVSHMLFRWRQEQQG